MTSKTKLKISQYSAIIFIIFWQCESWFFIIKNGWHLRAITQAEKICDNIASGILTISFIFFISLIYEIVEIYVKLKE